MCNRSNSNLADLRLKATRIMGIASTVINENEGTNRGVASNAEQAKSFANQAVQIIGQLESPVSGNAADRREELLRFAPGENTGAPMFGTTVVAAQLLLDKAVELLPADKVATLNDASCPVAAAGRQCKNAGACKRGCA